MLQAVKPNLTCPCCGQPVDRLDFTGLSEASMTPSQRRIVSFLASAWPRRVPLGAIIDAVYFDDPNGGPETARNVVLVHMSKLRQSLPAFGWTISNTMKGRGAQGRYQLERLP